MAARGPCSQDLTLPTPLTEEDHAGFLAAFDRFLSAHAAQLLSALEAERHVAAAGQSVAKL